MTVENKLNNTASDLEPELSLENQNGKWNLVWREVEESESARHDCLAFLFLPPSLSLSPSHSLLLVMIEYERPTTLTSITFGSLGFEPPALDRAKTSKLDLPAVNLGLTTDRKQNGSLFLNLYSH